MLCEARFSNAVWECFRAFGLTNTFRHVPAYLPTVADGTVRVLASHFRGLGIRFRRNMDGTSQTEGLMIDFRNREGGLGSTGVRVQGPGLHLADNIFCWEDRMVEGMESEIGLADLFVGMDLVDSPSGAAIREAFGSLGVEPGSAYEGNETKQKGARPREIESDGRVTGCVETIDEMNSDATVDYDGTPNVKSTNLALVPKQRVEDIQRAMQAYIRACGWLAAHELGHYLGLVSRRLPQTAEALDPDANKISFITVNGKAILSPLDGTDDYHNRPGPGAKGIIDSGWKGNFRTILGLEPQPTFCQENREYLEQILPGTP